MVLVLSSVLSIILSFVLMYFVFFVAQPESIRINGFINFLMTKDAMGGLIGGFIGMMALNLTVIFPFLIGLPSAIHKLATKKSLKSQPKMAIGNILNISETDELATLDISYNSLRKSFEVPNLLLTDEIKDSKTVVVYYDPSNPENAYLDLVRDSKNTRNTVSKESSVFKLLEITPKFDISSSSYELTGEIHNGNFKGQKASLIYELKNKDLRKLIPGTIFPCLVSGNIDNYSIDIELG